MDSFPHFPSPVNPTPQPPPPPPPHPHPLPPPFHPITPPPPPYSPDNGPTVIVVVFVSFGCVFFVAFCLFALWCVIKRRKKTIEERDIIRTDKHVRVKEAIMEGPHGPEAVVLSIEEDKHTEEEIVRDEKVVGKHLHHPKPADDVETGQSSANPGNDQNRH